MLVYTTKEAFLKVINEKAVTTQIDGSVDSRNYFDANGNIIAHKYESSFGVCEYKIEASSANDATTCLLTAIINSKI